jgi:capsular exopolysaccharide synthesis family protein
MNEPSPYFFRRAAPLEKAIVDLHEFSVVEDQIHPLRDYWLILKRHRWLILMCAFALLVCAALYTFTRTPLYTAEATLLIERKAPQVLKVQDARADSADYDYNNEFYKTQYEILKSRSLAERVIRDEGLENHPLFAGGKGDKGKSTGLMAGLWHSITKWTARAPSAKSPPANADPTAISNSLVGAYLSLLEVRPVSGTSLVQIKITTPEPALSARLANAHAFAYVRYGIDLRSQTNEEASAFLQQKLTELKKRVEQSEAALNSYRRDKGIISVDDKTNVVVDRLLDLNKSLTAAEAERIAFEAQVRTIRGRNVDELPTVLNSPVVNTLKAELGKLEAEYASLSKEFKPGYPPLDNLNARVEETRRRLRTEVQNQVRGIEAPYAAAKAKEAELRAKMEEQKKETLSLKDSAVQYAILAREVDTNKQLYDGVLQRLKEIGVAGEVRASNIYVMGKAQPPPGPSYPDKRRSLLIGLLMGLAAGVGLAFLLEQLDNTLKSPEEAERYMQLPNLAVVPDFALINGKNKGYGYGYRYFSRLVNSPKTELPENGSNETNGSKVSRHSEPQVLLDYHPFSVITEAYRTLRSSVLLSQAGGPPQIMLLTSAARGEGKTTTIINTAIVFAQLGIRVLIVDGDLRRPNCHKLLKMENTAGLADVLAGQIEWADAIKPTAADNLFLMSSGTLPPNPAELLGSTKMHEILQQMREQYQFIFIDSSPVMAVSDAIFLSTMVDGTLLVVNGKTPKPLVRKARSRLNTPHSKILGILLNRVDMRAGEYGSYYNHYYEYYGRDPEQEA